MSEYGGPLIPPEWAKLLRPKLPLWLDADLPQFEINTTPLTWRGRWRQRFTRAGEAVARRLTRRIAPRFARIIEHELAWHEED